MLKNSKTYTSFSAPDLAVIKDFYTNKLGLEANEDVDGVLMFKTAVETKFMIYVKDNHVPATYTVLNFEVEDIEMAVADLNEKGVEMEKYPEMGTDEKGIADAGTNSKMAWFKDPAGNILGLIEG
jgi:catechol 2,3-dioxygenase-like lactoylglutathione lyase family enzyme